MAIENQYKLSTVIKTQVNGGEVIAVAGNFETAAADDAGSKYRLCKVGANWVPIYIDINCDAIAGATDVDLGLYELLENGGAAKDADCFLNGEDISGGHALSSEQNGLEDIAVDAIGDQMYEFAGDSDASAQAYDLVLTMNSEVSAAGTIAIRALFAKAA